MAQQVSLDDTAVTAGLANHIKYLEQEDLVKFYILGGDEYSFYNRVKIQKFVFLAKLYGWDMPFEYNMHLYGPYSESLIDHCHKIATNMLDLYIPAQPIKPDGFDDVGFLDLVRGKSYEWLEMVTTMIDMNDRFPTRSSMIDFIEFDEYGFTRNVVSKVLDEAVAKGLVKVEP